MMKAEKAILIAVEKMKSLGAKPMKIELSPDVAEEIQSKVVRHLVEPSTIFGIPVAVGKDIEPGRIIVRSTEEDRP